MSLLEVWICSLIGAAQGWVSRFIGKAWPTLGCLLNAWNTSSRHVIRPIKVLISDDQQTVVLFNQSHCCGIIRQMKLPVSVHLVLVAYEIGFLVIFNDLRYVISGI